MNSEPRSFPAPRPEIVVRRSMMGEEQPTGSLFKCVNNAIHNAKLILPGRSVLQCSGNKALVQAMHLHWGLWVYLNFWMVLTAMINPLDDFQ